MSIPLDIHQVILDFLAARAGESEPLRYQKSRDGARLVYAAERAPKGGVSIHGKFYAGGRFIPSSEVAKASPEEKARLAEAKAGHKERLKGTAGKGGPDLAKLREGLQPHARELTKGETTAAKKAFAALMHHHGELTLHRLHQLIEQDQAKLAKAPEEGIMRDHLKGRLAAYHQMLDMVEQRGVTGQVAEPEKPAEEPKAVEEPQAKPEPAAAAPPEEKPAEQPAAPSRAEQPKLTSEQKQEIKPTPEGKRLLQANADLGYAQRKLVQERDDFGTTGSKLDFYANQVTEKQKAFERGPCRVSPTTEFCQRA